MTAAEHHGSAAVAVGRRHYALKYAGCERFSRTWERTSYTYYCSHGARTAAGVSQCEYDRALNRRHPGQDASGANPSNPQRQDQTVTPPTFQAMAGQRLLRGLPEALRRVRYGGAFRRTHPSLPAHCHRSRQPLALAIAVQRHDSHHAARFAELVQTVFPGRIEQILTDNGCGFQGAFADYARAQRWRHCHTYPRSPKMNAFNERFNRTVQEDFVDYEEVLLLEDLRLFNQRLLDYLDRYNGQRPHQGINCRTPCQMLAQHLPRLSHWGGPIHSIALGCSSVIMPIGQPVEVWR